MFADCLQSLQKQYIDHRQKQLITKLQSGETLSEAEKLEHKKLFTNTNLRHSLTWKKLKKSYILGGSPATFHKFRGNMDQDQQSRLKELIAKGKEQGFLTYTEVNDHLPEGIVEPEQIEDIIRMINDMGIKVHESAPAEATDILSDTETEPDEDAAEEAAAALASLDSEFGRTTDPVRMYMREMGTVELLTREGEIKIARRIEERPQPGDQFAGTLSRYHAHDFRAL